MMNTKKTFPCLLLIFIIFLIFSEQGITDQSHEISANSSIGWAFIYCPTYFMLFLHETDLLQINRIAVGHILLLQKSISQSNASVIESSLSRIFFGTP